MSSRSGLIQQTLARTALVLSLAAGGTALADERPDAGQRGEQLAGTWCSECHRAKGDEQAGMESGAIAFQDLAMDPDRTIESLRAFLSSEHPFMPFDELDAQDREDILAYMMWLKPRS